ncbi:MAG: hypothetical protein K6G73_10355 [Marinilabiliaceae bacterium]|nr:hypothetical protein [Marinilabiliaceae bacterium]
MINNTDYKGHIDAIIERTFKRLQQAYDNHQEGKTFSTAESRIVFPIYSEHTNDADKLRISEQELRFVFVETFNIYCDENNLPLFYSVETPTRETYSGFTQGNEPKLDAKGRSGEFDLVLLNKEGKRIALIEFKANNASAHAHKKDFVKLNNEMVEGDCLAYLIEVVRNYDAQTIKSLREKTITASNGASFVCYSLEKKEIVTIK